MFNLGVLDVAIGLAFVYLLLALVCTTVTEYLAGVRRLRAKTLFQGIEQLLGPELAHRLYQHPLVRGLMKNGRAPSYMPSEIFATALADIVAGQRPEGRGKMSPPDAQAVREGIEGLDRIERFDHMDRLRETDVRPWGYVLRALGMGGTREQLAARRQRAAAGNEQVQRSLRLLTGSAGGDDEKQIRQRLEKWFDDSMGRVTGWYRRSAQVTTMVVAFAVTIAMNADTLEIVNKLWSDPALRALAAERAKAHAEPLALEYPDAEDPVPASAPRELGHYASLLTPEDQKVFGQLVGWSTDLERLRNGRSLDEWLGQVTRQHAFGWALTAMAVSLGAPFWFDTLNRFINFRSSGDPPGKEKKAGKAAAKKKKRKQTEEAEDEEEA